MSDLHRLFPARLRGADLFTLDRNLGGLLRSQAGEAMVRHSAALTRFGAFAGGLADEEAEYTDRFAPPVLEPYDRDGVLVNRIRLNPLAERTDKEAYALGAVGLSFGAEPAPFLLTFAMGYLLSQSNLSLHCPVTMTGAVAYVLDRFGPPALRARYLGALTRMDGQALSGGTWATERQGGSDIGATTTRAVADGDAARLYGLKWFASNPAGGLSCDGAAGGRGARHGGARPLSRALRPSGWRGQCHSHPAAEGQARHPRRAHGRAGSRWRAGLSPRRAPARRPPHDGSADLQPDP
jgi:alkylation response protein AidB-like acyl-CoA dehydrogenase